MNLETEKLAEELMQVWLAEPTQKWLRVAEHVLKREEELRRENVFLHHTREQFVEAIHIRDCEVEKMKRRMKHIAESGLTHGSGSVNETFTFSLPMTYGQTLEEAIDSALAAESEQRATPPEGQAPSPASQ